MQRPDDIAVDQPADALHDDCGLLLHRSIDPFQHDTHKGILIEAGNKLLVLFTDRQPRRLLLHHPQNQAADQWVQVLLNPLPAYGVVDVHDKGPVGLYRVEDVQKALLPGGVGLFALQRTGGVLRAGPFHQVVNVLKVVVEGHAADAAVLGDVADGDFVQRLLEQQVFQRCLQRPFGGL